MTRKIWSEIVTAIKEANNILVVSHQSPDPDAFGSSCGMTLALLHCGKNALCLNQDGAVANLQFIPHASEVVSEIPNGDWDLIIVCDCGEKKRVGNELLSKLPQGVKVINLDHHYSNNNFGDLNLVDATASSASEVVFELVSDLLGSLTPEVAECLLTGIIADTGGFRYSSASAYTFLVAEKLIKAGAELEKINRSLFGNKPFSAVKLQAAAISTMVRHGDGKVVEMVVTEEMMAECQAEPTDTEGLADLGRDIAGVCVSVLIRKDKDLWKVSLRSKYPEYDVSKVAEMFGGGGHIQAAAFRYTGTLEDFHDRLIEALCQIVK